MELGLPLRAMHSHSTKHTILHNWKGQPSSGRNLYWKWMEHLAEDVSTTTTCNQLQAAAISTFPTRTSWICCSLAPSHMSPGPLIGGRRMKSGWMGGCGRTCQCPHLDRKYERVRPSITHTASLPTSLAGLNSHNLTQYQVQWGNVSVWAFHAQTDR